MIHFEHCDFREGYPFVWLKGVKAHTAPHGESGRFNFARGIEVRIADIAWCADAPYGS